MDTNDPPPSYNSVVRDGLRKRNQFSSDQEDNSTTNRNQDFSVRDPNTEPRDGDYLPNVVEKNIAHADDELNTKSTTPNSNELEGQLVQRSGLWDRIKKGLEDFAFFVIRLLD